MQSFEKLQKQIEDKINKLQVEERLLEQEVDNLLAQKIYIDGKIDGLSKVIPSLRVIEEQAVNLVDTIKDVSRSSDTISSKIRSLDLARTRVDECQNRVSDLIDLEHCSNGVQQAILEGDYETGAAHIHRFLCMDQSLLQRTATDVENVPNMLKSVKTLQDAANQLRAIVRHKFDEAVRSEDLGGIERFFKIFPMLGSHEEGIQEFCNYLRTKIDETSEKNLQIVLNTPISDPRYFLMFGDTVTLLFEGLAQIVDKHQPLIETYYGPGRLLSAVSIIQKECDIQMKKILLEWNKIRQVDITIATINELYRMNPNSSFSKIEKIDPKNLDLLIAEITIMHSRSELYMKFINRKVLADIEVGIVELDERIKVANSLDHLLKNSGLIQSKHILLSHYLQLEQYFMDESLSKAVNMDSLEPGQQMSSMVDDTFFIILKCIRRSISTGSLDGVCAVINNACRVLESDFCGNLRAKLKQGYPSGYLDLTYNVLQTSIQQGRLQSGDAEQSRTAFIIALNNADGSMEYVDSLCDNVLKEIKQAFPMMTLNERGKLESCLSGLSSATTTLKEIVEYGMQQLHVSAVKPRINPWIDSFLNTTHQLTEVEMASYESGESFVQTLIINLGSLLGSFKEILTPVNYDTFVSLLATEVTVRLEKVICKSTFNKLGGLVLDDEIRSLAAFLTASTSWSVRDKFARLSQIATILSLDKVSEINDYWGDKNGSLTWRLTPLEIRNVLALRTDFKIDDIRRVKL